MSSYKKKRITWIAETFSKELDRIIELSHLIAEKYGPAETRKQPLPEYEPYPKEFFSTLDNVLEEIQDEYLCTEKIAQNLFFTALRLRERNKI